MQNKRSIETEFSAAKSPASDSGTQSNSALLSELENILNSSSAEEIDVAKIEKSLSALQENAPVMENYNQEDSWKLFSENHPAILKADNDDSVSKKKASKIFYLNGINKGRRAVRIAEIVIAVLFLSTVTAEAFGYSPVQSFLRWAGDVVLVYSNPSGILELPDSESSEYHSLRDALDKCGATDAQCPTWIPKDYSFQAVSVKESEFMKKFSCNFVADRGDLTIRINSTTDTEVSSAIEKDDGGKSVIIGGKEYLVLNNADYVKTFWTDGSYSYAVYGQISTEELELIIKSFEKG